MKGLFRNAMYHGYGVMRFENGYVYEGNWKEVSATGLGRQLSQTV